MKCAHCASSGAKFKWTLTACANSGKKKVGHLCAPCDIKLNKIAMTFLGISDVSGKIKKYKES